MKQHLIRHQIESYTPQWYEFRNNGIGSSEIGTTLGLNQYQLGLSLFLEKIGYRESFQGNNATYFGTRMEQVVSDSWERHEPGREDSLNYYLDNGEKQKAASLARQSPDLQKEFAQVVFDELKHWQTLCENNDLPLTHLNKTDLIKSVIAFDYSQPWK